MWRLSGRSNQCTSALDHLHVMNIARISLMTLAAGVLAGCTFTVEADQENASSAQNPPKPPGTFATPFPTAIGALDLVSATPAEERFKLPDGPHHKILGTQLTTLYQDTPRLKSFYATGAQAEVTDPKAAVDWLTAQDRERENPQTDWVYVGTGPLRGAASCRNTDDGTYCYWADADTVGFLEIPRSLAGKITESFAMIRSALEGDPPKSR